MREVTTKVYNFHELGEVAKVKAISDYREKGFAFDDCDASMLTETFEEKLVEYGYEDDVRVAWSLSFCQGDGVAFFGTIDLAKVLPNHADEFTYDEQRRLYWLEKEFGVHITTTDKQIRYNHWNSMYVNVDCDYDTTYRGVEDYEALLEKLAHVITNDIQELSRKIEREGYEEIDYKNSDEHISSLLDNDNYEFEVDGTLY